MGKINAVEYYFLSRVDRVFQFQTKASVNNWFLFQHAGPIQFSLCPQVVWVILVFGVLVSGDS